MRLTLAGANDRKCSAAAAAAAASVFLPVDTQPCVMLLLIIIQRMYSDPVNTADAHASTGKY